MKQRTTRETAIICGACVAAVALLMIPFEIAPGGTANASAGLVLWMAAAGVAALGVILYFRYLTVKKKAQVELAGGEQYRQLADEYRRLADLAITAQEHTDLKLGDVSVHLDYLREQSDSLRKILKEVE
jgi:hypothetical protein